MKPPALKPPALKVPQPLRPLPTWLRLLLIVGGLVSLGLGLLGVVLPGLPTTPFVLLAAACFARASPILHRWLLHNRITGPMLRDWLTHRSLTRRVRWVAIGSMSMMVAVSVWGFRERPWLQLVLLAAGLIGAWVVLRIPVRR